VRRARKDDVAALAPLVYLPAVDMYDRLAGTRERALSTIAADLRRATLAATWVAELGGSVVGAMVAYPHGEAAIRTRRLAAAVLRRTPPWRWPGILSLLWRGHRRAPRHPATWLYIDALATAPEHQRRGVATALLRRAEQTAINNGSGAIVLETAFDNAPALALYARCGFEVTERLPAKPPIPAGLILVKR
jgi:ribosomal protein S18 acetylase RimI-like enzyme